MESSKTLQTHSLHETAALWRERLRREPVAPQAHAEFERWRAASPAHRQAYDEVTNTWNALQRSAQDPQLLALRHEAALRLTRRSTRMVRPLAWAAAVIFAAVIGVLSVALKPHGTFEPMPERYTTQIGERLTTSLADGSQVTLNSGTELQLAFDAMERKVRLEQGQALFEVAKEASRPFVVEAAGRRFVALGTSFDVRIDGERVQLTMLEGSVKYERAAAASRAASHTIAPLTARQQLTIDAHQLERVRETDPEKVTSWRRGQVIFEDSRLADAVAELNRYSDVRIELGNSQLEDLKISGAFATGRPTLFVEAMTNYFPVEAKYIGERSIVLDSRK